MTSDERATYAEDGVVHLRHVVEPRLVNLMHEAVEQAMARPSRFGGSMTPPGQTGRFFQDRYLYRHRPRFGALLREGPMARLAAEATDSSAVRIYFDHVFVKDAGTREQFAWHQDRPYWAVDGTQICSTWVALTEADAASSALEFVRGSHRWGRTFRPEFPALEGRDPDEVERALWDGVADHIRSFEDVCPAFEDHPDTYDVISFAVEPGDILLFDFRLVHRSGPNAGANRRAAISWRWLGDDAVWAPSPGADPIIGPDDTVAEPGRPITDDEAFPVIHPTPGAAAITGTRRPPGPEHGGHDGGP